MSDVAVGVVVSRFGLVRGDDVRGGTGPGDAGRAVGRRTLSEGLVQRKVDGAQPAGGGGITLPEGLRTGEAGSPLPAEVRAGVEQATGQDVGDARVHTGAASAAQAEALGARAFTVGSDIHFGAGDSPGDTHLLAHEAAHVAQQKGGGAAAQRKGLEMVAEHDPAEAQADHIADAVVAGRSERVDALAPVGGGAVARAPKKARTPTATLADFLAALEEGRAKDAATAWTGMSDADRVTLPPSKVVDAIALLEPDEAVRVILESKTGFTAEVIQAILQITRATPASETAWHGALVKGGAIGTLATCPAAQLLGKDDEEALARLVGSAKANAWGKGFKTKLSAAPAEGTTLKYGAPNPITVREDNAWTSLKNVYGAKPGELDPYVRKASYPAFLWELTPTDAGAFKVVQDSGHGPVGHFQVTPTKKDETQKVSIKVSIILPEGLLTSGESPYTLTVVDSADPNYFRDRFTAGFSEIMPAAFPTDRQADGTYNITGKFSDKQQEMILKYLEDKYVPVGLFNDAKVVGASTLTGAQRVLIASNILTYGKVKVPGAPDTSALKWVASCCGTWVNGVYAYAGTNFAEGYGESSRDQSGSPTGEKSYGSGVQGDNQDVNPEHAKNPKKAPKSLSNTGVTVPSGQTAVEAGVKAGSSPTHPGMQNMPFEYFEPQLKAGDWLYIDNSNTAGHSVIFVEWLGSKETKKESVSAAQEASDDYLAAVAAQKDEDTLDRLSKRATLVTKETSYQKERSVTFRKANVYNQPGKAGGDFRDLLLGFPESQSLYVKGVYAITHAPDSHPATTKEEMLPLSAAAAADAATKNKTFIAASKKKISISKLVKRLGEVDDALLGTVKASTPTRADGKAGLPGALKEDQVTICNGIIHGKGDDLNIVYLIALKQKLEVINIVKGNPAGPDGILTDGILKALGDVYE